MSEEQYNHMDQRFREAASETEHPFDEFAWKRMEKLLDQEEDRKRPFAWWWISLGLFLLLAGGAIVLYRSHSPKADKTSSITSITEPVNPAAVNSMPSSSGELQSTKQDVSPPSTPSETNPGQHQLADQSTNNIKEESPIEQNNTSKSQQVSETKSINHQRIIPGVNGNDKIVKHLATTNRKRFSIARQSSQSGRRQVEISSSTSSQDQPLSMKKELKDTNAKNNELTLLENKQQDLEPAVQSGSVTSSLEKPIIVQQVTDSSAATAQSSVSSDSTQKAVANLTKDSEKKGEKNDQEKKAANSRWYFLAGLGADVSSTKLLSFKHNPVSARYGLGIGYRFNDRWAIQTGVYATAKKYIAYPGDYKLSDDPYWSQVSLLYIDASCLVYEIPLQVRYDFLRRQSGTFFASAGLSSFIMKKETYEYYIDNNNYYYSRTYSYKGNKHPLSVLSFSAGWQYTLGKHTAMTIEPYLQIPMGGVGEGKVRLYSFGVQGNILLQPGKKNKAGKN